MGWRDVPDPPLVPELDERLLSAPRYQFLARRPLWNIPSRHSQIAVLGRWTEYSRKQLEALAGHFPFRAFLEETLGDENIFSQAWIGERWVPASYWQLDAQYLADFAARADTQSDDHRIAASMHARRDQTDGHRPGRGEAAYHLVGHLRRSRSKAMEIAALAGFDVEPEGWANLVRNGRKREKKGEPCRFC